MFLSKDVQRLDWYGFLRVRGGVSLVRSPQYVRTAFSPRTRRCFYIAIDYSGSWRVFSAYAEVFPSSTERPVIVASFLRVRGGVSKSVGASTGAFSVFSAYAEVFLLFETSSSCFSGFLRVRGGVSVGGIDLDKYLKFSPRTRRCFSREDLVTEDGDSFLRVRGGVSST